MDESVMKPADLSQEDLAKFVVDMLYRTVFHHVQWFTEVEHQVGMQKALKILKVARENSYKIQMDRLSKVLGFEMKDGIPKALLDKPKDELLKLTGALAANWLANDGVWFQAVEGAYDMFEAKRCNDSCWTRFAPFEAWAIKEFLKLPKRPGLEGLKRALSFRLYGSVNIQSILDDGDAVVFQMNDCRVQSARNRRGLEDYPCKSAGLVEYREFAEAIDDRIRTECIGCPPDQHPKEWFCAWRFTLSPEA